MIVTASLRFKAFPGFCGRSCVSLHQRYAYSSFDFAFVVYCIITKPCASTGSRLTTFPMKLTIKTRVESDTMHIDIVSVTPTGNIPEHFALNWSEEKYSNKVMGKMVRKARMFNSENFTMEGKGSAEDKAFLTGKNLKDGKTNSHFLDNELLQIFAVSQDGHGTVEMVWGFEEIEGGRHYTRRVVARNGDKIERVRMVYDYKGSSN
jgi:hypothetical protein